MKQRANLSAIGQQLGETTQSYIVAPLISAPNSNIRTLSGATRQIPDPSKTLKPAMGIERVMIKTITQKQDEVGSNGESVFEIDSKDSRIRLVGNRWSVDSGSDVNGTKAQSNNINDYVEVTFYGTGLNILTHLNTTNNTLQASVDGGAATTILTGANSDVLNNRNYLHNAVVNAASNLTLGTHTVRITLTAGTFFIISGVEILNLSSVTNIVAPKGAVIANGNKYNIGTDQAFAYATGFDGNPSLNGRGGKVVVYATPEGRVGKVIQQANGTQLNLASADHTNEEVIRQYNFREFGASRADDFNTLTGLVATSRTFTLDDGVTTLNMVTGASGGIGFNTPKEAIQAAPTATTNFITLTFIGTGLDIVGVGDGTSRNYDIVVNNTNVGNLVLNAGIAARALKVVSGLPYGTHTVRFVNTGGSFGIADFIVYGPKTPTLPDNAVKIAEYNLMATYQVAATANVMSNSTGVMAKHNTKEMIYINGTGGSQDWTLTINVPQSRSGFTIDTNRSGAYVEYTFWGTGFDLRPNTDPSISGASTLSLNGLTLNSTNFPTATSSVVGSATFALGTGIMTQSAATSSGNIISVRNLPLGLYRFRQTANSAAFIQFGGIDIITPIHISTNKIGSMSIADLDLINKTVDKPVLDLSKAKAWVAYDGVNQKILSSYNISAVLRLGTGEYTVFLEKPFKTNNYIVACSSNNNQTTVGASATVKQNSSFYLFTTNSSGTLGDSTFMAVCFGELFDE